MAKKPRKRTRRPTKKVYVRPHNKRVGGRTVRVRGHFRKRRKRRRK